MTQGFKATLFAGVITLGVVAPVFAAAPVITEIPDVTIGDLESAVANTFEYDAPFSLNDFVIYDGDESELLWSFGESDSDGLATQQYTINGVGSVVSGDAALAAEVATPNLTVNPGATISTTGTTLFRDIVLSNGAGPHPDPADPATAAEGKVITYFVSDGTDVDSAQAIVRSVDGANDSLSASEGWVERVDDTDFSSSGWLSSGVVSPGISNAKIPGGLTATVTPAQGFGRILGWVNNSLLPYNDVGPNRFVRGKFYVSTTNFVLDPTNQVPGFRVRVTNAGSINAAAHFEYAQTNLSSPAHEPRYAQAANPAAETEAGWFIRPGDQPNTPSLYRINLDPIDVPAAAGSDIGALFEAYAFSDSANGTLTLHEVILGTYNALADDAGTLVFDYNRAAGLTAGAGGPKQASGGAFNMEANFENGRRRTLYFPGIDPGSYATMTNQGVNGLLLSTEAVPTNLFGVGLLNVSAPADTDKLRLEPNKLYKAKYYATSDMTAEAASGIVQGNVGFRFQTAGSTLSYLTELTSTAGPALSEDGVADAITAQALPSATSANPDTDAALGTTGEAGGWYTVVVSSPLSPEGIREDYEDLAVDIFGNGFGLLGLQPGPGEAGPSHKDVTLGVDLVQVPTDMTVTGVEGPVVLPGYAQPNHGKVRVSAIQVYSYPEIDDGGYDFDGNAVNQ